MTHTLDCLRSREEAPPRSTNEEILDYFRIRLLEELGKLGLESQKHTVLMGSNTLANGFIKEKHGLTSSQRKRHKETFRIIRAKTRHLFDAFCKRGRIEWTTDGRKFLFEVCQFDRPRGNVLLKFRRI